VNGDVHPFQFGERELTLVDDERHP